MRDERLYLRLDGDPLYAPETSVPGGTMQDFPVAPVLRGHVSHIALYRESFVPGTQFVERVLPDGALRLIFHWGDLPDPAGEGGTLRALVAGASAAPVVLRLSGRVEGLSVTLRPGTASALLGRPAGELAGAAVALEDLWPDEANALLERLAMARNDRVRAAVLQEALGRLLQMASAATGVAARQASFATRLMAEAGGRRRVGDVARALGLGERRLQQLFRAEVGLSPRAWNRLARMHACLKALRDPTPLRWAALAVDAGFSDQSHLVREFQALCGMTPGVFLRQREAVSGSSKTPA